MKKRVLALSGLVGAAMLLPTCCTISSSKPKVKGEPEVVRKFQHVPSVIKTIKVAVIDTGLNMELFKNKITLCKDGHKDFTGTGLKDTHGHGTHISGLIEKHAGKSSYCQIIMKYYDPKAFGQSNIDNTVKAFELAIELGVDVINYSGGGMEPNDREKAAVLRALDKGIKVVAAAGNEHCDLDTKCKYFPAMYDDRISIVGNLDSNRVPAESSNSGSVVTHWEIGVDVESYCAATGLPNCKMTGTSQSTAIHSGKVVKDLDETYKNLDIDKVLTLVRTA